MQCMPSSVPLSSHTDFWGWSESAEAFLLTDTVCDLFLWPKIDFTSPKIARFALFNAAKCGDILQS